jgi:hypothetical protein
VSCHHPRHREHERAVTHSFVSNLLTEREEDVEAVLNPFSVFGKGEGLLRLQLGALSARHLRSIVRAYRLAEDIDLDALDSVELAELIVAGVRAKLAA